MQNLLAAGALAAAAGVMLGAFGAHALRSTLDPAMLAVWQTAVQYHLLHAIAIVVVAFGARHVPDARLVAAGWLWFAGIVLFSGSLYALSVSGVRWLGAITPLGGVAFIAGWLWLAWLALRASGR